MVMFRLGIAFIESGVKGILPVDAPPIQNADLKGVRRAMEGTAHAHNAILSETEFPVFINVDIIYGASAFALAATDALIGVDLEKPAVDAHRDLFDPK